LISAAVQWILLLEGKREMKDEMVRWFQRHLPVAK
jgi:hypothetical protein